MSWSGGWLRRVSQDASETESTVPSQSDGWVSALRSRRSANPFTGRRAMRIVGTTRGSQGEVEVRWELMWEKRQKEDDGGVFQPVGPSRQSVASAGVPVIP